MLAATGVPQAPTDSTALTSRLDIVTLSILTIPATVDVPRRL
jgi:hypothetical protein